VAARRSDLTARTATLWLGHDGLSVELAAISALLAYQPAWDRRIAQSYGRVPDGVRAVVLLRDGRMLPARRSLDDLRARWVAWQQAGSDSSRADTDGPLTHTSDETTD